MEPFIALLIPTILVVLAAIIIVAVAERFSPEPFLTLIIRWIVFVGVLIFLLKKFVPLLGF